jgi:hypothetical protein
LFSSKSDLLPAAIASREKRGRKGNDESRSYAVDRDAVKAKVGRILRGNPVYSGIGSPGRTIRMRWSAKVWCISGISIFGMWHVVQFFVSTGQARPE